MNSTILLRLYDVIRDRQANPPSKSYVVTLLNGGIEVIGEKITEEAGELIDAARGDDDAHTVHEAADLLFHTLVLLGWKNIHPDKVFTELERRFGTSGITEKENRNASGSHS